MYVPSCHIYYDFCVGFSHRMDQSLTNRKIAKRMAKYHKMKREIRNLELEIAYLRQKSRDDLEKILVMEEEKEEQGFEIFDLKNENERLREQLNK